MSEVTTSSSSVLPQRNGSYFWMHLHLHPQHQIKQETWEKALHNVFVKVRLVSPELIIYSDNSIEEVASSCRFYHRDAKNVFFEFEDKEFSHAHELLRKFILYWEWNGGKAIQSNIGAKSSSDWSLVISTCELLCTELQGSLALVISEGLFGSDDESTSRYFDGSEWLPVTDFTKWPFGVHV